MEKVITWKTGTGQNAEVTVEFETRKNVNADGDRVSVNCAEIYVTATIDGKIAGYDYPEMTKHPVAVAKIGSLGMTKENFDRVSAAISFFESTSAWQQKIAAEKKALEDEDEYDRHHAMITKIMSY